jgi:D-beta-D-heptose 7-phosphate kinase/D-beta-D-heptose 1-phosphate adenosyltransferase
VIESLKPDVLVKGGDWKRDQIVGSEFVKRVIRYPVVRDKSTTRIIQKMQHASFSPGGRRLG